jgi:circadian clock protein KaiB
MKRKAALSVEAMPTQESSPVGEFYRLKLYITGVSPRSARAISNIRRICEKRLAGRHDLEVVDICQHPALAKAEQILASPTLIKTQPLPARRFVGDMSQGDRIVLGLGLAPESLATAVRDDALRP